MLNKYPLWKNALILVIIAMGFFYSLPNIYPDDASIKISKIGEDSIIDPSDLNLSIELLEDAKIRFKSKKETNIKDSNRNTVLRLEEAADQFKAIDLLKKYFGEDFSVEAGLVKSTPKWMHNLGAHPMRLGLDLSGGVHFLLRVDLEKAIKNRLSIYESEFKSSLRDNGLHYRSVPSLDKNIVIAFFSISDLVQAKKLILRKYNNQFNLKAIYSDSLPMLQIQMSSEALKKDENYIIEQNLVTIRNRIQELGIAEPVIQRQSNNGIIVELPGVRNTAQAKNILGKSANLEFHLVAEGEGIRRTSSEPLIFRNTQGQYFPIQIEHNVIITGEQIKNARASFDEKGVPQVSIHLDEIGSKLISNSTRNNIGRTMAVVLVEKTLVTPRKSEKISNLQEKISPRSTPNRKIISLATIHSRLGSQFRITGLGDFEEASELALLLRAGSLSAPMYFAEEYTIGPSLGSDNVKKGLQSSLWAFFFVSIFIVIIYRVFGFIAMLALAVNICLLTSLMSLSGATLTLPGIGGIVLTMGMAVDSNVLIFSRIREEILQGKNPKIAINEGFSRAFPAILDSNLTTLLVAIILFMTSTGLVRGFSITMGFGVITSMFTSIFVTRLLVNFIYGRRNFKKIWI